MSCRRQSKENIRAEILHLDEEIEGIGGELQHQLDRLKLKIQKNTKRKATAPKGLRI